MGKSCLFSSTAIVLFSIGFSGAAVAQLPDKAGMAPILRAEGKTVPDQYIVVFKKGVARAAAVGMRHAYPVDTHTH